MIQRSFLLVLIAGSLLTVGCSAGNRLPPAAEQALKDSPDFELLSLNPDREKIDEDGFCGWTVLGKTTINDADMRGKLLAAFRTGVAQSDDALVDCFNPRHGIEVVHDGTTHQFVICFQCYRVEWYTNNAQTGGFQITDSPQETFDEILKASEVPLAEKACK